MKNKKTPLDVVAKADLIKKQLKRYRNMKVIVKFDGRDGTCSLSNGAGAHIGMRRFFCTHDEARSLADRLVEKYGRNGTNEISVTLWKMKNPSPATQRRRQNKALLKIIGSR